MLYLAYSLRPRRRISNPADQPQNSSQLILIVPRFLGRLIKRICIVMRLQLTHTLHNYSHRDRRKPLRLQQPVCRRNC